MTSENSNPHQPTGLGNEPTGLGNEPTGFQVSLETPPKKTKKPTKAKKISDFKDLLASNKKAALQALLTLNRLQTDSEKSLGVALKANGVGFSGYDAPILSSMALQLAARGSLSPKQMGVIHRLIPRYATQLLKLQGKI